MKVYYFAALVVLLLASGANAKEKEDPRLKQAEKIFVVGNSRSANEFRKAFGDPQGRQNTHWKNVCIHYVTNKDESDAVLEIVETKPLGVGASILPQTSATLTLKTGDVIWSNDSLYSSLFILNRLNEAVCRARGLK